MTILHTDFQIMYVDSSPLGVVPISPRRVVFLRNTVYGKAEKEGNCIVEKLDKQCLRQVIKRNSNRDKSCY